MSCLPGIISLCCVLPTMESPYAVSCYCRIFLCYVLPTTESHCTVSCLCRILPCCVLPSPENHYAVSFLLLNLTLLFPPFHGILLCCVLSTSESHCVVSRQLQNLTPLCPAFRGISQCCVLSTAESYSAVSCLPPNFTLLCPAVPLFMKKDPSLSCKASERALLPRLLRTHVKMRLIALQWRTRSRRVQQDVDHGYISFSTGRLWQAGN